MADSRSYGQGGPYRSDDGPSAPQGSKPNTDSRIGAIQTVCFFSSDRRDGVFVVQDCNAISSSNFGALCDQAASSKGVNAYRTNFWFTCPK